MALPAACAGINRSSTHLSLLALYALGGHLVNRGLLPVGVLVTAIGFTFSLVFATQGMLQTFADLRGMLASVRRVKAVLSELPPDESMEAALPPLPTAPWEPPLPSPSGQGGGEGDDAEHGDGALHGVDGAEAAERIGPQQGGDDDDVDAGGGQQPGPGGRRGQADPGEDRDDHDGAGDHLSGHRGIGAGARFDGRVPAGVKQGAGEGGEDVDGFHGACADPGVRA